MNTVLPPVSRRLLTIALLVAPAIAPGVLHAQHTLSTAEPSPGEGLFRFLPGAVPRVDDALLGDVNGDGAADLVESGPAAIRVHLGRANGTFRQPRAFEPGGRVSSLADFDGDGDEDILALGPAGSRRFHVLLNRGNGTFPTWRTGFFLSRARAAAAGDWDGDGDVDVAVHYGVTRRTVFHRKRTPPAKVSLLSIVLPGKKPVANPHFG